MAIDKYILKDGSVRYRATTYVKNERLTPHGVSGLKYSLKSWQYLGLASHPTRGEWIEIPRLYSLAQICPVSPHTG